MEGRQTRRGHDEGVEQRGARRGQVRPCLAPESKVVFALQRHDEMQVPRRDMAGGHGHGQICVTAGFPLASQAAAALEMSFDEFGPTMLIPDSRVWTTRTSLLSGWAPSTQRTVNAMRTL